MKPERLARIRKIAEAGEMRDYVDRRAMIGALRELLDYVDGLAGEYTADPPVRKPTSEQGRRISEYDGLQAGDVVASREVEYMVGYRPCTTDAIEIRRIGGRETALEATIIRPEDWLSGAWSVVRRAGEEAPA